MNPFEATAKVALEAIFEEHAQETKFGWLVPAEQKAELVEKLFEFLATSRALKDKGDRLIRGQPLDNKPAMRPGPRR